MSSNNKAYIQKSTLLSKRFLKETKQDSKQNPVVFVNWLIRQKEKWSSSSWRIYKGASLYFLKRTLQNQQGDLNQLKKSIKLIQKEFSNTGDVVCKKRVSASRKSIASHLYQSRTSNNKFKSVPLKEKELVFNELEKIQNGNSDSVAALTKLWIKVGVITGVRPGEWEGVTIKGDQSNFHYPESPNDILRIIVKNAKYSKEKKRANSSFRTLIMFGLSDEETSKVLNFYRLLNKTLALKDGNFEAVYKSVKGCLYLANQKSLPKSSKYITLYSARHQFVSDRKLMGEHPAYTAALLGHASVKTAQTTYGRKRSGKNRYSKISPSKKDVDRILKNTPKEVLESINSFTPSE